MEEQKTQNYINSKKKEFSAQMRINLCQIFPVAEEQLQRWQTEIAFGFTVDNVRLVRQKCLSMEEEYQCVHSSENRL